MNHEEALKQARDALQRMQIGDDSVWPFIENIIANCDDALAAATDKGSAKSADGNFNTGDAELDLLLGLTGDMAVGNCNMDTGMLWLDALKNVTGRLAPPSQPEKAEDVELPPLPEFGSLCLKNLDWVTDRFTKDLPPTKCKTTPAQQ